MRIAVAGAGAFGTALAVAQARAGREVILWGRDEAAMADMRESRRSHRLPGIDLPDGVAPTADPAAMDEADAVLLAVPAQTLRAVVASHCAILGGKALVACAKGIDLETLQGPSALIAAGCPGSAPAVLTGPSFAADIAAGLPTALTLACTDAALGRALQEALATPPLRLYRSADVVGAELGGALKNVIAIACGAAIGARLGESARAALMTRGFAEMTRLAQALGARAETLAGLSGFGDLALTCTSGQSRNYRHGHAIGAGELPPSGVTVEGAATAASATRLAERHGIDLPIAATVDRLVRGEATVHQALDDLLTRPLKRE